MRKQTNKTAQNFNNEKDNVARISNGPDVFIHYTLGWSMASF